MSDVVRKALIESVLSKDNNKSFSRNLLEKEDMFGLEEIELDLLSKRTDPNKFRVGFLLPTRGFAGNFGELPSELEKLSVEVLWLIGDSEYFLEFPERNKWLTVNDMGPRIRGVDAIVTASPVDCLPDNCIRILHDHVSFAPLISETRRKRRKIRIWQKKYRSLKDTFREIGALPVFLPFYDLVLTPSITVHDLYVSTLLRWSGYIRKTQLSLETERAHSVRYDKLYRARKGSLKIEKLIDVSKYRANIRLAQVGYCKMDNVIKEYKLTEPEKLIVYAPTPIDTSGTKESTHWKMAITSPEYGAMLLSTVCNNHPDYKIVYKPHRDEPVEVVSKIVSSLSHFVNFELDRSGSDYWHIYSRAAIMISDFSGTAYTFAIALSRPVIFFSPNEDNLPRTILNGDYCIYRKNVGVCAKTVDEVSEQIASIVENYGSFVRKIREFRESAVGNLGKASKAAAVEILKILEQMK